MGTNQNGKRFYQVKVKSLDVTSLKELGRLMGPLQRQAFRKVYGKILDLTAAEVFTEAVVSLAQYYDQPLRCFTFGDFQMVPTIEEFEEILGCPLGGRKPYLFSGFLPSLSKIAAVVGDSAKELDRMKQTRNGVVGLPRKYLEGKARDMASQEKWGPFADILALLIFGVVLFPNVDGLADLAAIDAFLAYHHSKESPVVAILADLFDTFDRRCEKNGAPVNDEVALDVFRLESRVAAVVDYLARLKAATSRIDSTLWPEETLQNDLESLMARLNTIPGRVQEWKKSSARCGADVALCLARVHCKDAREEKLAALRVANTKKHDFRSFMETFLAAATRIADGIDLDEFVAPSSPPQEG